MELMNKEIQEFLAANLGKVDFELLPIKKGGSDRSFYRVLLPDQSSFIFMHYGTDVAENSCWVDVNKLLAGMGVAEWRSARVAAPVMEGRRVVMVEGRVEAVEDRANRQQYRIVIAPDGH